MRTLNELRQARGKLTDEMKPLVAKGGKEYDDKLADVRSLDAEIARAVELETLERAQARPASEDVDLPGADLVPFDDGSLHGISARSQRANWKATDYLRNAAALARAGGLAPVAKGKAFRSMGEQLQAIARYYLSGKADADPRLVRAPTGASEVDPTGGGFLVQNDFATAVFTRAYDMGEILGEVNKIGISTNANSMTMNAVDETSRATGSRFGGLQAYWAAEGTNPGASKPKFRQMKLSLNKLMALMYITDEQLMDGAVLQQIAMQGFSEEIMFMTEDAVVEGTGAGQPLGVLGAPCTVSVPKKTGQASGTILYDNILDMYSRMWGRSRGKARWYINQDIEPQLFTLSQTIGVGGVPVYLPPGGISASPYATLLGRPVVPTEYNATLGTVGDIMLADYSQYIVADKGGVQAAQSMHVAFLTDEMVFRITYRVDGQPIWNAPLSPFKGSTTKSPFITLATR